LVLSKLVTSEVLQGKPRQSSEEERRGGKEGGWGVLAPSRAGSGRGEGRGWLARPIYRPAMAVPAARYSLTHLVVS
jgi:hypothetical protein